MPINLGRAMEGDDIDEYPEDPEEDGFLEPYTEPRPMRHIGEIVADVRARLAPSTEQEMQDADSGEADPCEPAAAEDE